MVRRCVFISVLLWALLAGTAPAAPRDAPLRFDLATADSPPFSTVDGQGFYDRLLAEVFARLEIELTIHGLPSERALREANSGRMDGEFGRIPRIGELYSNLVMVDEPLTDWNFQAFVRKGSEAPSSFGDLRDYHVAYIDGWKFYEERVTETRSTTLTANETELFAILEAGRIDVALYNRLRGLSWIARNPGTPVEIAPEPLEVRSMHLFLHEDHAELAPRISRELTRLKESGRYAELQRESFGFLP